jgi:hypothetical protein
MVTSFRTRAAISAAGAAVVAALIGRNRPPIGGLEDPPPDQPIGR